MTVHTPPDKELKTIGSIAMWSARRTKRADIMDALVNIGEAHHVPDLDDRKNFEYSLGRACKLMAGSAYFYEFKRKWRGWHAPDPMLWDIVQHVKTHGQIVNGEYKVVCVVACDKSYSFDSYRTYKDMQDLATQKPVRLFNWDATSWSPTNPANPEFAFTEFLRSTWNFHRGELSGGEVSQAFKNILDGIGAEPLKQGNSVYWLAPELTASWHQVREAMSSLIPCQSFTQAATPESLSYLQDIVSEDLNERCTDLEDMVRENSTHKSSLEKRARLAREVRAKIQKFDSVLGTGLDGLRERLGNATATRVQAEASAVSIIDDEEIFSDLPF